MFAPKVGELEAVLKNMRDLQKIQEIGKRLVYCCIVFPALGAGNKSALPNDIGAPKVEARAVARIQHPVILRAGGTFPGTQFQISRARERQCASGDMPEEANCRLVVIDVE